MREFCEFEETLLAKNRKIFLNLPSLLLLRCELSFLSRDIGSEKIIIKKKKHMRNFVLGNAFLILIFKFKI